MFKIDLIVWKQMTFQVLEKETPTFKIDLIVWKLECAEPDDIGEVARLK